MTIRTSFLVFAALVLSSTSVIACNIPVYRYALERWHPDPIELLVFSEEPIAESKVFLRQLRTAPLTDEFSTNARANRVDPQRPGEFAKVWKTLTEKSDVQLPHVVVRTDVKDQPVNNWHGTVDAAKEAGLLNSPARRELHKRLLNGDAIVWLMLKSKDEKKNKATRAMLDAELKRLEKKIKLPDGIGQPGSELYADVPLVLQFTVLEIDPTSGETYLTKLLTGFHTEAYETEQQPLLAPVFGRGRVLEVLPASAVDSKLVEELTTFLCGACSCKVKGLNPGFDLLMSENWDVDLFGEDGERPSENASSDETPLPTLITIPPGRKKRQ